MTFDTKKKAASVVSAFTPPTLHQQVQRQPVEQALTRMAEQVSAVPAVPFTTTNSRSVSAVVQRTRMAPALTAADLLIAEQAILQRVASEVQASEVAVSASRQALAERGLRPESAAILQRRAPKSLPTPPVLTALQRQAVTHTAQQAVTAAFTRDARYLPGAVRAELALDALQRAVQQGADSDVLQARLSEVAKTPQDQAAVQRAVTLQRQQEAREAQVRDGHALQVAHLGLQRQLDEALARHTEANLGTVTQRVQARQGGGEPLPSAVQRHLEAGLNADLSRVRVHTDEEATKLAAGVQAEAFTSGQDIYFAANRYDPTSESGLKLLAHETTHTVQQAQGKVAPGLDPDAGLEAQAQEMGERLASLAPSPQAATPDGPQASGPASTRGALQRASSPAVQRKTAPPTAAALVEALHKPGSGEAVITTALSHDLPEAFWTKVMALGSQNYGRDWSDAALKKLPAPLKAKLTLALLGGEQELTYAAFINQLAYLVYSNDPSLNDAKQISGQAGKKAQGILQAAGYQAHPTIHGYWGFQMRVFTPIKGHPKPIGRKTIVAFRGTEGIKFLPKAYEQASKEPRFAKSNESGLDTMTDLAAYHTGYSQYEANEKQIIGPALKAYGADLVATGHSLGGALAQITVVKNPNRFSEVYTFQGANIKKSDVEKLAAMQKVKARYYRVTGDSVPSSGEKGIPGQVYEFDRKAGTGGINVGATWRRVWKDTGEKTESPDASDGHNSPILLEVLQDLQGQGLAKNALAQNLVKNGSQDPNELAGFDAIMPLIRTVPSSLDTTPGKEGLKQAVTGSLFVPQFRTTYENNVVYNLLLEQILPRLQKMTVQAMGQPRKLIGELTLLSTQIPQFKVTHTVQSLQMLDVILKQPEAKLYQALEAYRTGIKASANQSISVYNAPTLREMEYQYERFLAYKQRFLKLDIPQKVFDENRNRLMQLRHLLDLWYSAHPAADGLYSSALGLLPQHR
ncbi:hypothetical protein Dcar01_03809 [Deinococcus carri]|uniref:eCIS core domain-containing protein n=1 Tax=Deinococcus carri TaxID=1211323 RepID=A0ABP9WEX9_9DEIO